MGIPRCLHQVWIGDAYPAAVYDALRRTWRKHHPDWEMRFWTGDEPERLIADDYPEHLDAWHALGEPVAKADFFRYLVVHRHGGAYADLDTSSEQPLDPVLRPEDRMIVGLEADLDEAGQAEHGLARARQYCNWTFLAEAGHPALARACEIAAGNALRTDLELPDRTGPGIFTDAVKETGGDAVRVLPIATFGAGQMHSDACNVDLGDIHVLHHFYGTWRTEDGQPLPFTMTRERLLRRIWKQTGRPDWRDRIGRVFRGRYVRRGRVGVR